MAGGRPLKYKTKKTLQAAIDSYFDAIDAENSENAEKNGDRKPYTVAGLALHLDVDTETLRNYDKRDEFFGSLKKAKQRIEVQLETKLHGNNVTGIIFNLKNNYGWKDRQDITTNDNDLDTVPKEVTLKIEKALDEI